MLELGFTPAWIEGVLDSRDRMGLDTSAARIQLREAGDSRDRLAALVAGLGQLPPRAGWPYVEPDDFGEIQRSSEGPWADPEPDPAVLQEAARRAGPAFLASVCGCILGKPVEIDPSFDEMKRVLGPHGAWPLRDYFTEAEARGFGREPHESWGETVRERIRDAAPDDDINYTLIGLEMIETHGTGFTGAALMEHWFRTLPIRFAFGPERLALLATGLKSFATAAAQHGMGAVGAGESCALPSPKEEFCGALIRVDAYGYACPGRPALAAWLAWKDASCTHRKTGVYGAMWMAAALALAPVCPDWRALAESALGFVPRRSRFHERLSESIRIVSEADRWETAAAHLHERFREFGHCWIYREAGTLVNTLRFAPTVHDGFCMQVMQGADTDSFGARAGALLGMFLGPERFDRRWLDPLHDTVRPALGLFRENRLSVIARRIAGLPARTAAEKLIL